MKILITGGAGFVGSYLVDKLLDLGNDVIVMDNLVTGRVENLDLSKKNLKFINHNVSNYIDYDGDLDWVMHFASPASPDDFARIPIQILKVGSLATLNTLGLAKSKNAKYFLASTSEVYGDPLEHPQKETYNGNVSLTSPRAVYDEAKRFSEAMTHAYRRFHGIDTRIVRIFNTYGPRMRKEDGRVVTNFISQALENRPITVYGDGKQTRSFQYVDDLIDGIIRQMNVNYHDAINIGNPNEFTILELAEIVKKITGSKSEIIFKPLPEGDPQQRRPDISRAKEILNWEPKISLEEGLKIMVNCFKAVGAR